MSAVERVCYFFLAIVFSFFSPINSIDVSNYLEHLLTKKGGGGGSPRPKPSLKDHHSWWKVEQLYGRITGCNMYKWREYEKS